MNLNLPTLIEKKDESFISEMTPEQMEMLAVDGLQAQLELNYLIEQDDLRLAKEEKILDGVKTIRELTATIKECGLQATIVDMFGKDLQLLFPEVLDENVDVDKLIADMEGFDPFIAASAINLGFYAVLSAHGSEPPIWIKIFEKIAQFIEDLFTAIFKNLGRITKIMSVKFGQLGKYNISDAETIEEFAKRTPTVQSRQMYESNMKFILGAGELVRGMCQNYKATGTYNGYNKDILDLGFLVFNDKWDLIPGIPEGYKAPKTPSLLGGLRDKGWELSSDLYRSYEPLTYWNQVDRSIKIAIKDLKSWVRQNTEAAMGFEIPAELFLKNLNVIAKRWVEMWRDCSTTMNKLLDTALLVCKQMQG